jgi:Type II secretion system (T2SS), protein G
VRIHFIIRIGLMISFSCFYANAVHAELNKKEAKRLISKVAGMSLPSSAVRIESINSTGESTAEVSTELELVFRLARDDSGQWQVKELRTADARWENIELILHAAKIDLQEDKCGTKDALGRVKPESGLNVKRARCLIASLFDVPMPSDSVRIQEISDLGVGSSALAASLVRADFRFVRDAHGWRVSEFHSGNRSWIKLESVPDEVDSLKRTRTNEDMNTIATALEAYRGVHGSFVIAEKHSVLIDTLTPRFLHRVIRLDSWHHPFQYQGASDHFTIRSLGPDGKENTADDLVVTR